MSVHKFFDSDGIYLPTLYRDLFINSGSYIDWYGSAAPYYFPDMFLYFISNFITSDFYYAIALYFTIISCFVAFALYKIYRIFYSKKNSLYLSSILFALVYVMPSYVYIMQFVSVFHFGEFVVSLLSTYLLLEILSRNHFSKHYIYLFLLSIVTVASDNMYILHFIIPTLCALLVLWSVKIIEHKKLLLIYATLISSLIIGKIMGWSLVVNQSNYSKAITLSYKHLTENVQRLIEIFHSSYNEHFVNTVAALSVLIVFTFIFLLYKRVSFLRLKRYKTPIIYISLFYIFMILGNLAAVSFLYPNTIYQHYMIPLFLMPLFMIPIIIKWTKLDINKKKFKFASIFLSIILVLLVLFRSYDKFKDTTLKSEYYPKEIECFDSFLIQTGAKDGLAGFWESKTWYMLSKHDVNIAQYNYDFTEFRAVNTIKTYKNFYDFAIIKNKFINKKKLISINGKPTKIFKCEEAEIFYYENKLVVDKRLLK